MGNTKHTPGPWEYDMDRNTHDCIIYQKGASDKPYGYIQHGRSDINNERVGVVGSSEWIWIDEADAKLIAAAPEMFDALETVYNFLKNGNQHETIVGEMILATINKASGH